MRAFRISVRSADGIPLDPEEFREAILHWPSGVESSESIEQLYPFTDNEVNGVYVLLRGTSPEVSGVAADLQRALGISLARRVLIEVLD